MGHRLSRLQVRGVIVLAAVVAMVAGTSVAVAARSGHRAFTAAAAPAATTGTAPSTTTGATSPGGVPESFYDVPSPLPAGAPGAIIRTQAVDLSSLPSLHATALRIMYHSRSVTDADIAVTGVVVIPGGPTPAGGRKVVDWAHGTYGTADACAPSKGGAGDDLFDLAPTVIAAGDVLVGTDYEGLGTPGLHPYLVGRSEGRSVLDAMRAVRNLPAAHASDDVAIWGHSQGGHATLWATQLAPTYAPELHLVGSVPIAPASHVYAIYAFRQATHDTTWGYLVMLLAGLHATYPSTDLRSVFTPAGFARIGVTDTGCEDDVNRAYDHHAGPYWFRHDPLDDPVFGPLLEAQEPAQVRMATPLLVLQGTADDVVPFGVTRTLDASMCAQGQQLQAIAYPGKDHQSVLPSAWADAMRWTTARFAGRPAGNDCPRLLAAAAAHGVSPSPSAPGPAGPVAAPARLTG